MPRQKIEVKNSIRRILHLPGGQQIITCSWDGVFQVWDLERGTQVGEEWKDEDSRVEVIALSPGGKIVASGSWDGTVRLWNVDTGKVINTWTGHTDKINSVCWSPDGGRLVSGSEDRTFRVWDVERGTTILGPIKAGGNLLVVCYSPDGTKIVTGGDDLKFWDASKGELLKTLERFTVCLAWTLDGRTLIAGGGSIDKIIKFDTATWSEIVGILDGDSENFVNMISLSPNECILASTSYFDKTARLWNFETNQPIGTPLHHGDNVNSATFSADGKFLVTGCDDNHIYTWDLSAIVKDAGLLSDIADVTAPNMKATRRVPPGFFDDALRDANLRIRQSQSNGPNHHPTPTPPQPTLSPFSSFWRRSRTHRATEPDPQPRSHSLSWTRNLVSHMLRRRNASDIQLREPPVVDVPYTAGKPRNYHATGKPPSAVPTAGRTGTISRPHITGAGWHARFVGWVCCMPIQNTDGHH